MSKLTLDNGYDKVLATVDLGDNPGPRQGFAGSDVRSFEGNIYLRIDGREYGSLYLTVDDDGEPQIMLGQFDVETQQWEERHTIKAIPIDHQITPPKELQ